LPSEAQSSPPESGELADAEFERLFNGTLYSLMSWDQLADFWRRLDETAGWYVYAPGERLPTHPSAANEVRQFIEKVDDLLHRDHKEPYCGIVFADNIQWPTLIKIYDPNHLGSSCGSSGMQILPGWVMSRVKPTELRPDGVVPANRRRWWQALFAG
jgi:hypothetical protein